MDRHFDPEPKRQHNVAKPRGINKNRCDQGVRDILVWISSRYAMTKVEKLG
jgi:hypothetical protein